MNVDTSQSLIDVKVAISASDWIRLWQRLAFRRSMFSRIYLGLMALSAAGYLATALLGIRSVIVSGLFFIIVVMPLVFHVLFLAQMCIFVWWIDAESTVSLNQAGINVESEGKIEQIPWATFAAPGAIDETKYRFWLAYKNTWIFVPKRSFACPEDLETFRRIVAEKTSYPNRIYVPRTES